MTTHASETRSIAARIASLRTDLAIRLLYRSKLVDALILRISRLFRQARSAAVLAYMSDESLERLGVLAYSKVAWYRPHGTVSWPDLFDWESAFLEAYAPSPPARVLVGGAGAGREPYQLARMGYDVTAFEPIPFFVEVMHRDLSPELPVNAWQGRYEDLPRLRSVRPDEPDMDLSEQPHFDVGIFGWSSFSHVLEAEARPRALKAFSAVVNGPILISVFTRDPADDIPTTRLARFRRRLPGRNRDPAFEFQISTGVYRAFTEAEMLALCRAAGLEVVAHHIPKRPSHSGWLVVRRVA